MLVNQASNALVGGQVPTFGGNDHPNIAPYGPVPCADRSLVVGAGNDAQFAALCRAIGLQPAPGWATNAGRVLGRRWGVLVGVLDVLKGLLPTVVAAHWMSPDAIAR